MLSSTALVESVISKIEVPIENEEFRIACAEIIRLCCEGEDGKIYFKPYRICMLAMLYGRYIEKDGKESTKWI